MTRDLSVLRRIHATVPACRVVVFTGRADVDLERVRDAGGTAIVMKGDATHDVVAALVPEEGDARTVTGEASCDSDGAADADALVRDACSGCGRVDPTPDPRIVWAEVRGSASAAIQTVSGDLERGTQVEVQRMFDGRWAGGFLVERAADVGYWLARSDRSSLPAPIRRGRVRERAPG